MNLCGQCAIACELTRAIGEYNTLLALAALIPLGWAFARTRDPRLFSAALLIALAAALTGRLTYAILHWEYFSERPAEVFSLAGLSEHGAILGGTAAYLALRRTVGNLAATCSAVFVLATVAASVGCVEAGCAYGREVFWQTDGETSLAWQLRVDWPDAYQVRNPRWPTQIFMSIWMVACGLLLRRHTPEALLLCFGLGDFGVQFLRADQAALLGPLRLYQWIDLVFIAISLLLFMFSPKRVKLALTDRATHTTVAVSDRDA